MLFGSLLLYKFILTAIVVVGLSFVAEQISPRWAGILSGFPTGTAITLYFYGLENGLEFAGSSAIFNMVGLVAMQMFILCYYLGGMVAKRYTLATAVCCGMIGYGATVGFLAMLPVTPIVAVVIPVLSFVLFKWLFSKIESRRINKAIQGSGRVVAVRAIIAALTIALITGVAHLVGHSWAGLFSAFPATLFPLLMIIHYSYGRDYAFAIIKHVPDGLGGLLIYSLILYLVYPGVGLLGGIGLAFGGAFSYLLVYQLICQRCAEKRAI